jgi:hypothetical protein
MKSDYTTSLNKKAVQNDIFKRVRKKNFTKVVGLGGPNITQYLQFLKSYGIKYADIYENDRFHILLQISSFKPVINTNVHFNDIICHKMQKDDTLYDLDFCSSIYTLRDAVKKFRKNSIFTFSARPIGVETTITEFFKCFHSKAKPKITYNYKISKEFKIHKAQWKNKTYMCYVYKDTTPMLTITQF